MQALQATLKQAPQLVNAHSRAGENLWHFAAQGGHVEVSLMAQLYALYAAAQTGSGSGW